MPPFGAFLRRSAAWVAVSGAVKIGLLMILCVIGRVLRNVSNIVGAFSNMPGSGENVLDPGKRVFS